MAKLKRTIKNVVNDCKLSAFSARSTPQLKIIEIISISRIPGESFFKIQITNKNTIIHISAANLIAEQYNLNLFSKYHAQIITNAGQGTLIEFLKQSNPTKIEYKIIAKKFNHEASEYIFTLENNSGYRITRTADDILMNKDILKLMHTDDIYDIGFTTGSESIIKEKNAILRAKNLTKISDNE